MNRQSMPVLRRVGFGVGVVAAAAVGGGVAMGATVSGTQAVSKIAPKVATCATSQLRVWYGEPAGAAAGSTYIPLEFSNTGTTDCALDGYPGVSGVTAAGAQLGTPASRNAILTPSNVVLTPGATAHVILQMVDVYNYPSTTCVPTAAYGLRVYPPNNTASVVLPIAFEACSASGPNYLSVDVVNAGVGIPLYTSS